MAYVSPQVEGKIKNQSNWVCTKCGFNGNQINLTQCQYCGYLRFNPMQKPIQPSFVPPPQQQQQFNNQPQYVYNNNNQPTPYNHLQHSNSNSNNH
eukprot:381953_1